MTERKLIEALTQVCEEAKKDNNGFQWLTHLGHWRSPEIIAVFDSEVKLREAMVKGWDIDFINSVNMSLAEIKSTARNVRFDSEEACLRQHSGNWDKRLLVKQ